MEEALARLSEMRGAGRQAIVDQIVEEGVRISGSSIGYFAVMNETEDVLTMLGWSKSAMGACSMIDKPIVYPLEQTGLWGDCVREREPSITNDYELSERITKKGYPEGHVAVVRHMNVPVWQDHKIVGILGVGNKSTDYSAEDSQKLQDFANRAWQYVPPAA